jgi:SAM-dependent methyltransferase
VVHLHRSSYAPSSLSGLQMPMRLLKQVLVGRRLNPGGRVLVAGCGHGELPTFLANLAYSVDALDDSHDRLAEARQQFPQFEFLDVRPEESLSFPDAEFDLVVVQDLEIYSENLLDPGTRIATANLLTCLKPGADLVFIRKVDDHQGRTTEHLPQCWQRHLACFPGEVDARDYRESIFSRVHWDWLCGTRDHGTWFTVRLQTPLEKFSHSFWRGCARRGLTAAADCCVSQNQKPYVHRRAA